MNSSGLVLMSCHKDLEFQFLHQDSLLLLLMFVALAVLGISADWAGVPVQTEPVISMYKASALISVLHLCPQFFWIDSPTPHDTKFNKPLSEAQKSRLCWGHSEGSFSLEICLQDLSASFLAQILFAFSYHFSHVRFSVFLCCSMHQLVDI